MQACPGPQATPHAPHWLNEASAVQRSVQSLALVAQPIVHVPDTQLSVGPQGIPQAPQLAWSLSVLTQKPLQLLSPGAHIAVHCPFTHVSPFAQSW
jgi:hypothetical protein